MVAILQTRDAPTRADFHDAIAARGDRWFAVCLRITRDRDLAEDAVQDALLSAWNKREQFDRSAKLETWIHRIAVNAALQLIRKRRPDTFEALDDDVADDSMLPDVATAADELGDRLAAAMAEARLSDMERTCFVLKHLEQWRLKEIAEELSTNDGRVKQAVFRAVHKLRPQMAVLQGETT
jgi:RNA polymerase sigma-70 factor (ECF subfamily)